MNARIALLVLVAGAAVSSQAMAQNQYQQQIANQITRGNAGMQRQGYLPTGGPMTGSLNDDADASVLVSLIAGVQYAIVGVCDNDCTDVDLQVFSGDNTKIGEDLDTDDTPVVVMRAAYSGQYRVRVMMATCNTSPCYYGVQVYQSAGGK